MKCSNHYFIGMGKTFINVVKRDIDNAIIHFSKATKAGYADGYFFLGLIEESSYKKKSSYKESLNYYKIGAAEKSSKCLYKIGLSLLDENVEIAKKYLEKAYYEGTLQNESDPVNMYIISDYYLNGYIFNINYDEGIKWLEKSSNNNYNEADYKLGLIYKKQKDIDKAVHYFKKASDQFHPLAMYELAKLNIEKNYTYAIKLLEESSSYDCNAASNYLAEAYKNIKTEYFRYYLISANNDDFTAMKKVAICYKDGVGVKIDFKLSDKWFKEAFSLKIDDELLYQYSDLLIKTNSDENLVLNNLVKAAELNNKDACYDLALIYLNGYKNIVINENSAFYWCKKAVENNNELAYYLLGMMYIKGIGTTKNETLARVMFQKSSDSGNIEAASLLKKIKEFDEFIKI